MGHRCIEWRFVSIDLRKFDKEEQIFVSEAPEFLIRNDENPTGPTTVIQPEGTTVQLKCLASGKPMPDIRWKKNGKILSEDEYGVTQSVDSNI